MGQERRTVRLSNHLLLSAPAASAMTAAPGETESGAAGEQPAEGEPGRRCANGAAQGDPRPRWWTGVCFLARPLDTRVDAFKNARAAPLAPPPCGGSLRLLALLGFHRLAEAEAFAVHLEDVTAVRQSI